MIREYSSADRLAVQLATARPQRPGAIARVVRNRLESWISELIGYPSHQPGEDRFFDLAGWIKAGNTRGEQVEGDRYPPKWARMAFACLATEADTLLRCEAVYKLLTTIGKTGRGGPAREPLADSEGFLREAGKLLSTKKISPGKVVAALQFAHPLEERSREAQTAASEKWKEANEANERSRQLTESNLQLQRQIDSALIRERELQRQLAEAANKLAEEEERIRELEKHWEETSEQNLARQRHKIVSELSHDLQEARLALDRESPNREMALNRIRRAEDTIHRLDPSK